jgi:hypothetical protein
MNHYPLTQDHIRFYEENGYIQLDNVLNNVEVEVLRKALAQAVEDKNKYNLNLRTRTDDGLTFHYAGPNVTDIPCRAMVTIFIPAGITYKKHTHIVGDRGNLHEGEKFHGPLVPILARG